MKTGTIVIGLEARVVALSKPETDVFAASVAVMPVFVFEWALRPGVQVVFSQQ